jgi:membrane AbrB-like protein
MVISLHQSRPLRWLILVIVSVLVASLFEAIHLPAALLLGPLVVAAAMAACNLASKVPSQVFRLSHAVIGTLIAKALPLSILGEMTQHWPVLVLGVVSVIVASSAVGWVMARFQVLPGTTAIWGAAPGAATAMVLMAGSFGADTRLVAFMQYLRSVMVVIIATVVARIWMGASAAEQTAIEWFPHSQPFDLAATLAFMLLGAKLGQWLRIPAGSLLVPLILGAILGNLGIFIITLPPWLLAPTYAVIGWQIGSRFDRPILLHAARALPGILAGIAAMVVACGSFAVLLVTWAGIDPFTAYLATSPGGIDSIAIIGMSSSADMPFVMAMQTSRFLVVLLTGPWLARVVATRVSAHTARRSAG